MLKAFRPEGEAFTPQPVARFVDKVAIVTGASDRGIGGATAERLAREGASLALLSNEIPNRLLRRLERLNVPHFWTFCDVTQPRDVEDALEITLSEFEHVDVLVNCAGVAKAQSFAHSTDGDWQQVMDVNLNGAARVTRAALPSMRRGGAIVNISSALGMAGCVGMSAYSASKAGLIGMTQCLAWELAPRGIRALCISPGVVHTPLVQELTACLTDAQQKQVEACHPLGLGSPHDVASVAAFAASDDARWITGITLPIGWAQNFPLPLDKFMEAPAKTTTSVFTVAEGEVRNDLRRAA